MAAGPNWKQQPNVTAPAHTASQRPSLPSIIASPNASSSSGLSIIASPGAYNQLPSLSRALSGHLSDPNDPGPLPVSTNTHPSTTDAIQAQPPFRHPSLAATKREGGEYYNSLVTGPADGPFARHDRPAPDLYAIDHHTSHRPILSHHGSVDQQGLHGRLTSDSVQSDEVQNDQNPTKCKECASSRGLVQEIVSNLLILGLELSGKIGTEIQPSNQRAPEVARDGTAAALKWASDNILAHLHHLRRGVDRSTTDSNPTVLSVPWESPTQGSMTDSKRKHGDLSHQDDVAASKRFRHNPTPRPNLALHGYGQPKDHLGYPRHPHESAEHQYPTPDTNASTVHNSSFSASSPNLGTIRRGNPTSPQPSTQHLSAQEAYTQDLQHQLSLKTITLQTLEREYNSLLKKIERQRAKCSTLERKFEVTDTEINSLTDEKERLQGQVTALEEQIAEVQKARDEARTQSVANNGQYLKIMEMSSRLQQNATEDKKRWAVERERLEAKIEELSKSHTSGPMQLDPNRSSAEEKPRFEADGLPLTNVDESRNATDPSRQLDLDTQIQRLRHRNIQLEAVLRQAKEDCRSVQRAQSSAQQIHDSLLDKVSRVVDVSSPEDLGGGHEWTQGRCGDPHTPVP